MEGYEELGLIGCGSFGKVYKGMRKDTNEFVAIKKICKRGRHEREIQSLRQECEIQKRLHHPNIIKMLDSFETTDTVFVVTEFARGDLCKVIGFEGWLTPNKVQLIACQMVSALYFLHSNRILHRDIKPQNILIGMDWNAKLCDFGFARTMGMGTYLLTSIKGTPLYMAPEIVLEKPYDHNADLWSLGCILYELVVSKPPFYTTSLFQLVRMISHDDIVWPEHIADDLLSFLKGLLTKDPKKRLTWPDLLHHPYVHDGLNVNYQVGEYSLTKALSPSQEIAKAIQCEKLQRRLAGYSKIMARTAKKMKEAQKELQRRSEDVRMGIQTPLASPNGVQMNKIVAPLKSPHPDIGVPPQHPLKISPNLYPALPDAKNLKVMFRNLNLNDARLQENKDPRNMKPVDDDDEDRNSGASSCETMTSSSEFETDDSEETDEDTKTVIMETKKGQNKKDPSISGDAHVLEFIESNKPNKTGTGSRGGSGQLWKSGALFTLHSFGSDDKPILSDEWIRFLLTTMKEVVESPKTLCEKPFLTILVTTVRNHLAEPEVVEKIARVLSVPFTLDESIHEAEPGLLSKLLTQYLETKVLPNLLYACKLIVRRRCLEHGSLPFEAIPAILTVEDLEGLEKCLRLVTYLVYIEEEFVTQLCDSVCILQAFIILQLFLKLDAIRPELTADTMAILCHILRTIPSNKSIVEEILLDENGNNSDDAHGELWRLLTHTNTTIQCRSIRLFTRLSHESERVKTEFLGKRRAKIWKVLSTASISEEADLREAAKFALKAFNFKTNSSAKSNSTTSNSGCRSQSQIDGIVSRTVGSTSGACDEKQDQQTDELTKSDGAESLPPPVPPAEESSGVEMKRLLSQDELSNESSR